ncbi:MAG: nucleotidyl transferase AbiEii/AbiGii toxin family protein [Bacteroidota bacterium]
MDNDIDLSYINTEARETAMLNIRKGLATIQKNIEQNIPGVKVNFLKVQLKIQISKGGAVVKIEVNQGIRGLMNNLNELILCERAQKDFDAFCSIQGVPLGQLYGGKICAALYRQHPRDLFDVHYMLENEGITKSIKEGFLFTLFSSGRSMQDILFPNKIDQRATFENQFKGMTLKSFTYSDFEITRNRLLSSLHDSLTKEDKEFILAFKNATPNWDYLDLKKFRLYNGNWKTF